MALVDWKICMYRFESLSKLQTNYELVDLWTYKTWQLRRWNLFIEGDFQLAFVSVIVTSLTVFTLNAL